MASQIAKNCIFYSLANSTKSNDNISNNSKKKTFMKKTISFIFILNNTILEEDIKHNAE